MTRREIEDYLIERSLVDSEFRDRLIQSPHKALEELGLPLGEGVEVNVYVEEPGSFSIVLPRVLKESGELTSEELSGVAGGATAQLEQFFRGYV